MEDDKIKDLFSDFRPDLSSDTIFLSKLRQNINAIEKVKQQVVEQRKRNKIAVIVAALVGFVTGIGMTLITPMLSAWISSIKISIAEIGVNSISLDGTMLAWIISAATCGLIAYNTYQITLSKLHVKKVGI